MSPLDGTRVLVTGASSGLGLAMARALYEAGARVAVTSRDGSRARATADQLSAQAAAGQPGGDAAAGEPGAQAGREPGAQALGLALDVRDEDSVERCLRDVDELFGGLDVLVNNAGIGMLTVNPRFMSDPQPFWSVPPAGFRDVVGTKATGCFLMARAAVPLMLERGGGRIVNISMNEQTMVRRGFVPYGPAGAAVEALSRVMAADLAGTAVTVNILLPGGATATGMVPDDAPAEIRDSLLDPAIMGPPIVWLASEAAAGVHDQRIVATEFEQWLASR